MINDDSGYLVSNDTNCLLLQNQLENLISSLLASKEFQILSLTRSVAVLPVNPVVESILLICGRNPSFTSHTGVFIILFYLILLFRNAGVV